MPILLPGVVYTNVQVVRVCHAAVVSFVLVFSLPSSLKVNLANLSLSLTAPNFVEVYPMSDTIPRNLVPRNDHSSL